VLFEWNRPINDPGVFATAGAIASPAVSTAPAVVATAARVIRFIRTILAPSVGLWFSGAA